jgi:hypothetical protein
MLLCCRADEVVATDADDVPSRVREITGMLLPHREIGSCTLTPSPPRVPLPLDTSVPTLTRGIAPDLAACICRGALPLYSEILTCISISVRRRGRGRRDRLRRRPADRRHCVGGAARGIRHELRLAGGSEREAAGETCSSSRRCRWRSGTSYGLWQFELRSQRQPGTSAPSLRLLTRQGEQGADQQNRDVPKKWLVCQQRSGQLLRRPYTSHGNPCLACQLQAPLHVVC